jgi:hypothetical protein
MIHMLLLLKMEPVPKIDEKFYRDRFWTQMVYY